jgi:hypothetical protein
MAFKYYSDLDLQQLSILNFAVNPVASDPGTPVEGETWVNTTTNQIKFHPGVTTYVLATITELDNVIAGLAWKDNVRVATTAEITISTDLNSGDTIDGVTLADGDRVLVKNQTTTPAENGIYVVGATPVRSDDMIDKPFMSTASLPVSMMIENKTATSQASSMDFICAAVCQEGEPVPSGYACSIDNYTTSKAVTTSFLPVLAVRLKTTFQGKINRSSVLPRHIHIEALNNPALIRVLFNPTLTGTPTWVDGGTYNPMECSNDVSGFSGGHNMGSMSVAANNVYTEEYFHQKFGSMA